VTYCVKGSLPVSDAAFGREGMSAAAGRLPALRERVRRRPGEGAVALRAVYAGAAAYAALFAFAAVVHYFVFKTPRGDLGNMVQAVWNTLHGHFLETTTASGHQRDRLGFHVDPLLLMFAPVLWIWSSPLFLPMVQAFAVASGALPVFWLARKHLGSPRAGAHLAFAYLLYPATQFSAFTTADSFHAVSLAVPLVLYAIWYLDEERLVSFAAVGLVAFTTKEEIPLAIGCLGIWYAVRTGRRAVGLGIFTVGLAVTVVDFKWVIPHFSAGGGNPYLGRYSAVGGTPQGIAHKLITDPMMLVHTIATGHNALYLSLLLVPLFGLCLLEPLLLLGAVPDLAINLLSSHSAQASLGYHYTAGIVPFFVAATILGASRFNGRTQEVSLFLLAGAAGVALFSPILLLGGDLRALGSPLVAAKRQAVGLIPHGVPVSASNQLGGHLSERRYITTFPYAVHAHWIIVDSNDSTYSHLAVLRRKLRQYESNRAWQTVFSSHGVVVLRERPVDKDGRGR
jgi:uncharacterized membrane protein